MRSGRRSHGEGEASRSRTPRSTFSPQHVEWLWRTWREREEHRIATTDGVWEPRVVEEEPTIPSRSGAEDATPSRRQRPLRREHAERLLTTADGWKPPAVEEEPTIPSRSGAEDVMPSWREDPSAADRQEPPAGRPTKRAFFPLTEKLLDPRLAGLLLIGVVFLSAPYALYGTKFHDGIGRDGVLEPLAHDATASGDTALLGGTADAMAAADDEALSAPPPGEPGAGAVLLERIFTFEYGDGLREQELTLDGCDVVVADILYDAQSGARERLDISRFELRRFHLVDSGAPDRLLLSADAEADRGLLRWYDALAEATDTDEEGWVQTLVARADGGEFGSFLAGNRHETQALSSDGMRTPLPRPLLQVSIRVPQDSPVPAAAAWRTYVRDHCPSL